MIVQALAFYMFATIAVACGIMVITSRNPVHSVLYLILTFFNVAGLFVLQGAEFIAMILVIVYVGAVAVLFLFVVMMLDIDFRKLRQGVMKNASIGVLVGIILVVELGLAIGGYAIMPNAAAVVDPATLTPKDVHNTAALGNLIYTHYFYLFQGAGLVLLLAMVGAIALTLRTRKGVKKQNIPNQLARSSKDEIEMVKVKTGGGI